jgi:hypothetical protein
MSATAIRQAPGWWASLVHAVCDDCGWHGPVRDCNSTTGDTLARLDRAQHQCGKDSSDE